MLARPPLATLAALLFAAAGHAQAERTVPDVDTAEIASRAKEILRSRCAGCHGETSTQAGVDVLDYAGLVDQDYLTPGDPEDSILYLVIESDDDDYRMPKDAPPLSEEERSIVRQWIRSGAESFPEDVQLEPDKTDSSEANGEGTESIPVGREYVLERILEHQRDLSPDDRRMVRYFSCNHLLVRGATRDELTLQYEAFAKGINHLSMQRDLVRPEIVDGDAATVFAIDLRDLGWHRQVLKETQNKQTRRSEMNLYDLVLLEYPYSVWLEDSLTLDKLTLEYLTPAKLARPIPYVRTDWFCSVVLQPPLYHDLLQLPRHLDELEAMIGVDSEEDIENHLVRRAGMAVSGVSRNNRAVQWHSSRDGSYWKSIDYASSRGSENLFTDPIKLQGAGGEMIYNLPNGLQAYYLADGVGNRLNAAPTSIVTDKFAEDKVVRNGLSCIRCHDRGMKDFRDDVRPAVENLPGSVGIDRREVMELYPSHEDMNQTLREDRERFMTAVERLLGHSQRSEPLIPVSGRYLDSPMQLGAAIGELGVSDPELFRAAFRTRQFTTLGLTPLTRSGVVRRDMWEDAFDQIVRALGLGIPVVPIDGVLRDDYTPANDLDVRLSTKGNQAFFRPGDELVIQVTNHGKRDAYVELIGTGTRDEKVVIVSSDTLLSPGESLRFPETGSLTVQSALGQERITLYASDREFPAAKIITGKNISDRVLHDFFDVRFDRDRAMLEQDVARMLKKTLVIETR
ncbi:MAG: c-type cytochrome domain-containing protein [Planctomycetota bacterium]